MQDRYEEALTAGTDEEAWLRQIIDRALGCGCVAVSVNGSMWPRSRGRTIAIHVGGDEDALALFLLGSPPSLKRVKRFSS